MREGDCHDTWFGMKKWEKENVVGAEHSFSVCLNNAVVHGNILPRNKKGFPP